MDWYIVEYVSLAIVFQAITIGGIYALGSTSLTMVWGSVNFPNLALGAFFTLGAYSLLELTTYWHMNYFEALGATLVIFLPAYLALDRGLFYRFYKQVDPAITLLLISIGLLIFTNGFYDVYLSYNPQIVETPYSLITFKIGNYTISEALVIALALEYAVVGFVLYFMRYTRYGRVLRAMVQDKETVALMGVDSVKLSRFANIVSLLIGTAGGTMYALTYSFDPTLASNIAIAITVIALVGGIGSVFGTVVVSLMFGLIGALASFLVNPVFSIYIYYGILFAILFLRPQGLFRR